MPPRQTDGQMVGIDLIRFLAAALVTLFHLGAWCWLVPETGPVDAERYPGLLPFARSGWIGVEIFFVISGFVIAYSADGASASGFARSRVLRLVPAAWICASLTFLVLRLAGPYPTDDLALLYAKALVFWPGGPWIDGVFWTLGIEIAFYATMFALLATGAWRFMPVAVGALGLASAAFQVVLMLVPSLAWIADKRFVQLILLNDGCLFALGVYLWLTLVQGATRARLAMLAAMLAASLIEIRIHEAYFTGRMLLAPEVLAPSLLFLAATAALTASVVWNAALVRVIGPGGCRIARLAGLTTYPLYLLHNVCGEHLIRLLTEHGMAPYPALAAGLFGVLALSVLVTRVGEPDLRALLARLLPARRALPAPVARTA